MQVDTRNAINTHHICALVHTNINEDICSNTTNPQKAAKPMKLTDFNNSNSANFMFYDDTKVAFNVKIDGEEGVVIPVCSNAEKFMSSVGNIVVSLLASR